MGLDDFAVREILIEHLGRKLECECQVLNDERKLRIGGSSGGNSGLILTAGRSGWWIESELQNRFRLDFRFGFGILTLDDGLAGFSGWGGKWGLWTSGTRMLTLTIGFEHHKWMRLR